MVFFTFGAIGLWDVNASCTLGADSSCKTVIVSVCLKLHLLKIVASCCSACVHCIVVSILLNLFCFLMA